MPTGTTKMRDEYSAALQLAWKMEGDGKKPASPFGRTHPERDITEMCPYCYNEDTRRMRGPELAPFEEYHKGEPFKAFECEACSATFHFKTKTPCQH